MRLSIPPNSIPPALSQVQDAITRLRAEAEQAELPEQMALLLFELGVLQEVGKDDHSAAKDLLSAINSGNLLREPIERLIFLIERRRSYKNLGKLLDRLGRVANSQEEIVRAQVARGEFLTDCKPDFSAARDAYDVALGAGPRDSAVWLSAQVLAAKAQDSELHVRVLAARSDLAQDPAYRALLLLNLARFQVRVGDEAAAQRTLEGAAKDAGIYRFTALAELLRLVRRRDQETLLASCQTSQAELLAAALEDADVAAENGIPGYRLTQASAADAWLGAALSHRVLGDEILACQLLARAQQLLPESVPIAYSHMLALEAAGDMGAAVAVARRLMSQGRLEGSASAALSLRLANAELAAGNVEQALAALRETLEADPRSVPARALQLNLLPQTDMASELAAATAALATAVHGGLAKVRYWLLAAFHWSHGVKDGPAAKAALAAAGSAGADGLTVARVGRTLAALARDTTWETECVAQLVKALPPQESASLRLELARASWLSGQDQVAREQLTAMSGGGPGRWAASVLLAYGGLACADGSRALLRLASHQKDRQVGAALRLLVAYRAQRVGDSKLATEALQVVQEERPADAVAALLRAVTLIRTDSPHEAAEALATTAAATEHLDIAQAFLLQAGLLHWRNNDREGAVRYFEQAHQLSPEATASILSWALRSARPDLPEARRRALTTAQESEPDADLSVLERFALEVGLTQHRANATAALDQADEVGLGDVGDAVQLTRALWTQAAGHADALSSLDGRSAAGLRVARALAFTRIRQERETDAERLVEASLLWAETRSLPSLLEALAAVQLTKKVDDEIQIRRAIAKHLDDEGRDALLASASIVQLLTSTEYPDPLPGNSPQVRLTNVELCYPGSDPRRRAAALTHLEGLAGEETRNLNLLLIGVNQLAAADFEAALVSFQSASEAYPDDIAVYAGMRDAAKALGKKSVEASATFRVAQLSHEAAEAAALFRRAAQLWLDELQNEEQGYAALTEAVQRDFTDGEAFQRLFRFVRDRQQHQKILDLAEARLVVAKDVQEITKLYWERARANRALNRTEDALLELSNVRLLDAEHVGAMALSAEIYLTLGRHADAAKQLSDLAAHRNAPSEQRLMSGMAAVDIYETKLDDLSSALAVLATLKEAKLSTLPVRERLARAAAKSARWQDAADLLEELMHQRDTREGRVEAARLCLAIYRDRLEEPAQALAACRCLLQESPADAEAIDLVLDEVFDEQPSGELLRQAKGALIQSCVSNLDAEQVARLARVAEHLEDLPLRQGCLGVLVTLGITSDELRAELRALDERSHHHPKMAISDEMVNRLLLPDAMGPAAQMLKHLAPTLTSIIGPSLKSLDVGRKQRIKALDGSELRAEIAHWAGAFGLGEFELYVGGPDPDAIVAVADDKLPAFVVGENIRPPFGPDVRQLLACRVFALSRGSQVLLTRESADVAALLVAACRVVSVELNAPAYALVGEFHRLLSKELPRKVKKDITECAQAIARDQLDLAEWAEAALTSLRRVAALAIGDPSWVLLSAHERRLRERNLDSHTEMLRGRVLSATLSEDFRQLREQLGLAVK